MGRRSQSSSDDEIPLSRLRAQSQPSSDDELRGVSLEGSPKLLPGSSASSEASSSGSEAEEVVDGRPPSSSSEDDAPLADIVPLANLRPQNRRGLPLRNLPDPISDSSSDDEVPLADNIPIAHLRNEGIARWEDGEDVSENFDDMVIVAVPEDNIVIVRDPSGDTETFALDDFDLHPYEREAIQRSVNLGDRSVILHRNISSRIMAQRHLQLSAPFIDRERWARLIANRFGDRQIRIFPTIQLSAERQLHSFSNARRFQGFVFPFSAFAADGSDSIQANNRSMVQTLARLERRLQRAAMNAAKDSGQMSMDIVNFTFQIFDVGDLQGLCPNHLGLRECYSNCAYDPGWNRDDNFCFYACVLKWRSENCSSIVLPENRPYSVNEASMWGTEQGVFVEFYTLENESVTPYVTCPKNTELPLIQIFVTTVSSGDEHFCLIKNIHKFVKMAESKVLSKWCKYCQMSFAGKNASRDFKRHSCGDRAWKPNKLSKLMKPGKKTRKFTYLACDTEAFLKKETERHIQVNGWRLSGKPYIRVQFSYDAIAPVWENVEYEILSDIRELTAADIKKIELWKRSSRKTFLLKKLAKINQMNRHVPCSIGYTNIDDEEDEIHMINQRGGLIESFMEDITELYADPEETDHTIRCFFHNLKNYDSSHFSFFLHQSDWVVEVLIGSIDKFKYLRVRRNGVTIDFVDSLSFLLSSVANMGNTLVKEVPKDSPRWDKFKNTVRMLSRNRLKEIPFERMTKQVFPYEWLDCFEKTMQREFPPRSAFGSSLSGEGPPSEAEYNELLEFVDNAGFGFEEYMMFYLAGDVNILAMKLKELNDWSKVAKFGDYIGKTPKIDLSYKQATSEGLDEIFVERLHEICNLVGKVDQKPFSLGFTNEVKEIGEQIKNSFDTDEKLFRNEILSFITLPSAAKEFFDVQCFSEQQTVEFPATEDEIAFLRQCRMGGRSEANTPPGKIDLLNQPWKELTSFIGSNDQCGLYCGCQFCCLARTSGVKKSQKFIDSKNLLDVIAKFNPLNRKKTFFIKCSFYYPESVKNEYWDFPPVTSRRTINGETRLMGDFFETATYVDSCLLFLLLKIGVKVKRVHEVWKYGCGPIFRKGAFCCNLFRQIAPTTAEQDAFKNMVNSNYGKQSQNPDQGNFQGIFNVNDIPVKKLRVLKNLEIVTNPEYPGTAVGLVRVRSKQPFVKTPFQAAVDILFLSKAFMLNTLINMKNFQKSLGNELFIAGSDTDSFMFFVTSEKPGRAPVDAFKMQLSWLKEMSCVRKLPKYYLKKISECVGEDVIDSCLKHNRMILLGLASDNQGFLSGLVPGTAKMYQKTELTSNGVQVTCKGKGVDRRVLKEYQNEALSGTDLYEKLYDSGGYMKSAMVRLKVNNHQMSTIKLNKITLNFANHKRIVRKFDSKEPSFLNGRILKKSKKQKKSWEIIGGENPYHKPWYPWSKKFDNKPFGFFDSLSDECKEKSKPKVAKQMLITQMFKTVFSAGTTQRNLEE